MDEEVLDDMEEAETSPRRGGPPRLGSFVTIAAAILLLFGAASRVGKTPETLALFGIDRQAENRIRREEERLRAAITLGAMPVGNKARRGAAGSLPVRESVLPPFRGEFDLDEYRNGARASISMAVRNGEEDERGSFPGSIESLYEYGDERPEEQPQAPVRPDKPEEYVVAAGDTWVKISQRTLGDAKRWREIMNVNPNSSNGLTVGMRLLIPR